MMSGSKAPYTIIIEERQNRRKDIMKIGFIGLGNMATAMIGGMLPKGIAAGGKNQAMGHEQSGRG